jgi:hypothetical protein
MDDARIYDFVKESNAIEGIVRSPTEQELKATQNFLGLDFLSVNAVIDLVRVYQPGAVLRDQSGAAQINVRVGNHIAPAGGPSIRTRLEDLIVDANVKMNPYWIHCRYETLHPFSDGNGRSGRAIWMWQMQNKTDLGFLHAWYYQSLQDWRREQ